MTPATVPERRRAFRQLLVNTLVSSATTQFLWFALSFWVYLETRSVVAVSVIGGSFALASAVLGVAYGSWVDHHRKHAAIVLATTASLASFVAAGALYLAIPSDDLLEMGSLWFWLLVALVMIGAVAGNLRAIVLSTCVTLLVDEPERDRANGAVGTVNGVAFTITSVFSGLVIGQLGMGWALAGSTTVMTIALIHLLTVSIDEPTPEPAAEGTSHFDVRAALAAIRAVPGLGMLVGFAAFNNFLGGVFMALLDAYGLSLVSVETWGLLFAVLSLGFIAGGWIVARRGLGRLPLRVILAGNVIAWAVCSVFTITSSITLLAAGLLVWMVVTPIVEAAEQTVLQRTVPFETQGRVFGFAQTVENAAAPITSFLIGPLAEIVFIPSMTDGWGADAIGGWFGTGPDRGLALIFTTAGIAGTIGSLLVWASRSYRRLLAVTAADAA